jgi:hypothetical protein
MTFQQISQRGKQYLETADTLLRTAKTMTDLAIAGQFRALPTTTSGEPRRPRMLMRPKHSLDRLLFGRCMLAFAKITPTAGSRQLFPHRAIRLDTKGASMKLLTDCAFSTHPASTPGRRDGLPRSA